MMGPCLEFDERRARAYVRSRTNAATGLTGLDVCFWGASRSCCGVLGVRALQKTIAETIDLSSESQS